MQCSADIGANQSSWIEAWDFFLVEVCFFCWTQLRSKPFSNTKPPQNSNRSAKRHQKSHQLPICGPRKSHTLGRYCRRQRPGNWLNWLVVSVWLERPKRRWPSSTMPWRFGESTSLTPHQKGALQMPGLLLVENLMLKGLGSGEKEGPKTIPHWQIITIKNTKPTSWLCWFGYNWF